MVSIRNSVLCEKHFLESDFIAESKDRNLKYRKTYAIQRKRLKPYAIPTQWPGTQLSKSLVTPKAATTTIEARIQAVKLREYDEIKITSFAELNLKINAIDVAGFTTIKKNCVFFLKISLRKWVPKQNASLAKTYELGFVMAVNEKAISEKNVQQIGGSKISTTKQIVDLLKYLDNLHQNYEVDDGQIIDDCISMLSKMQKADNPKVSFISEQLDLFLKPYKSRRYSPI